MIKQNVDAEKFILEMINLSFADGSRFSLLDAYILIHIYNNGEGIVYDIEEMIYDSRGVKNGSLHRPLTRLKDFGFIDKEDIGSASSKNGERRVRYFLTKKGTNFINRMTFEKGKG